MSELSKAFSKLSGHVCSSLADRVPDDEYDEIRSALYGVETQIEELERVVAALRDALPALSVPDRDSITLPPNLHLWPAHVREDHVKVWLLMRWANGIRALFGVPVWLCGSALNDDNKNPRDWDVRLILPDDVFALRYANSYRSDAVVQQWVKEGDTGHFTDLRWDWSDECVRYARHGARHTRLNIDFQVYPESYHQRFFADKPRVQLDSHK